MRPPLCLPEYALAGVVFLGALALAPRNLAGQASDTAPAPPAAAQDAAPASQAEPGVTQDAAPQPVVAQPSPESGAPAQQASGEAPSGAPTGTPRLIESEERLGAFTIGGQMYAVVAREESFQRAKETKFAATLGELEIRDASDSVIYQEEFPYEPGDGRFARKLSASASLFAGDGGAALALRFIDEAAASSPAASTDGNESWEVFDLVNGRLTRLGPPLPLGQGGDGTAVGGVLTGVMVRGGIGVVPLASKAEALEFRAWTGNFFVYVPVRVDWANGQWSEAEECFELNGGSLRAKGCNLNVAAVAQPRADGSTLRLYPETVEDRYNAQQVLVHGSSQVQFLAARAVVNWKESGGRITCSFDDVWLRTRIDGKEGWVHSEEDFATLGMAAASPPQ